MTRNGDQISLSPSTAHAGEVWLEIPPEGYTLITHGFAPGYEPLTDDEIARLGRQDTQGMTVSGTSPTNDHWFTMIELKAGRYAFIVFDETAGPDVDPVGRPPLSMAILEITP